MKPNNPDSVLKYITALAMGCFFILGCENSDEDIKHATSKRIGVEQAKGVTINYSLLGKTKARITAPIMLRYQDTLPYLEFPKTIHVDFYNDSLRIESQLDALYAKYMESENRVFLKDSVKVINLSGDTLYCRELYWDRSKTGKEFYTDKPVRIRTKTHVINGSGLVAPQDFKSWNIIDPKGTVKVPESQFPS